MRDILNAIGFFSFEKYTLYSQKNKIKTIEYFILKEWYNKNTYMHTKRTINENYSCGRVGKVSMPIKILKSLYKTKGLTIKEMRSFSRRFNIKRLTKRLKDATDITFL